MLAGIVASAFSNQLARRRVIFENQLRIAMEDGESWERTEQMNHHDSTTNTTDAAETNSTHAPLQTAPHSVAMHAHLVQQKILINGLGFGGLLPFYGMAATVAWGPANLHQWALTALSVYAGIIIAFIGGVSWALALVCTPSVRITQALLIWSVVPPLLAAASFMADVQTRLWLMVVVLALAWIADKRFAIALGLPAQWIQLRAALSLLAIGALSWAAQQA